MVQYLMEFNSSPGDLMELSPLFSDDSRVAEAASIAQKLRTKEYCLILLPRVLFWSHSISWTDNNISIILTVYGTEQGSHTHVIVPTVFSVVG